MQYSEFLTRKSQYGGMDGFDPLWMPEFLYDFQKSLVTWAVRRGRCAIFADCGLGKTPMQLVWAENIVRHTNKPVLIVTPLAVSHQTLREANKFGIEAVRSSDGSRPGKIIITNYEKLHLFNPSEFIGAVCDESSILKNFDGKRKAMITEFMRRMPYRLACTATAAPNDYVELGTTSEALGELGYMDMLTRFFRNIDGSTLGGTHGFRFKHKDRLDAYRGTKSFWRFKHHAEIPFWKWVCSWARALRRPEDMGYDNDGFVLPPLIEEESIIKNTKRLPGMLFVRPAVGLKEEREERKLTISERCALVAAKVKHDKPALVWCHLNEEGDELERMIPDAVQVSGADDDDKKEERFLGFSSGKIRVLITKPKIGGFGMNWQHCSHVTFFPSHSFEQYYQGVRRCWRFGQSNPVKVDIVTSEGELGVLANLQRKAQAADLMFTRLVSLMNDATSISTIESYPTQEEIPSWL